MLSNEILKSHQLRYDEILSQMTFPHQVTFVLSSNILHFNYTPDGEDEMRILLFELLNLHLLLEGESQLSKAIEKVILYHSDHLLRLEHEGRLAYITPIIELRKHVFHLR